MVKRLIQWWEDTKYDYAADVLKAEMDQLAWASSRCRWQQKEIDRLVLQVEYMRSCCKRAEKTNSILRKQLKKSEKK